MKKLCFAAATIVALASPPAFAQCAGLSPWNEVACENAWAPFAQARRERLQRRIWEADHPPTPEENAASIRRNDEMARRAREDYLREEERLDRGSDRREQRARNAAEAEAAREYAAPQQRCSILAKMLTGLCRYSSQ